MNSFAFRMPHSDAIAVGRSATLLQGLHPGGFVIAPFDRRRHGMYTVPLDDDMGIYDSSGFNRDIWNGYVRIHDSSATGTLPSEEIRGSREAHARLVNDIVRHLYGKGKIVAARRIHAVGPPDIYATFMSLCRAFPSAFVFMFSTAETGTWIGATPELLLKAIPGIPQVSTMALAGTLPADNTESWDAKNIEEQRLVTDFISGVLRAHMGDCSVSAPETLTAGPVRHICTRIDAPVGDRWDLNALDRLLCDLAPTPAVCGSDREDALEFLGRHECFDRQWYGGFCGVLTSPAQFALYVSLRCAAVGRNGFTLFAGGGITPLSDPDTEWEETVRKSRTMLNHLKFID